MFRRASPHALTIAASSCTASNNTQRRFESSSSSGSGSSPILSVKKKEEPPSPPKGPAIQFTASMMGRNDYNAYARKVAYVHAQTIAAAAQGRGDVDASTTTTTPAAAAAGTLTSMEPEVTKSVAMTAGGAANNAPATGEKPSLPPTRPVTARKKNPGPPPGWTAEPVPESMELERFLADASNLYWALGDVMTRHVEGKYKEFNWEKVMAEIEGVETNSSSSTSSSAAAKSDKNGADSTGGAAKKFSEAPAAGLPPSEAFFYPEFSRLLRSGYDTRAHPNPHQVACSRDALIKAHLISFEEAPLSRYKESVKSSTNLEEHNRASIKTATNSSNKDIAGDPWAARACFATVEFQLVTPVERHCGTLYTKYLRRARGIKDVNEGRCLAALMSQAGGFTHTFVDFWDWMHQKWNNGKGLMLHAPDPSLWERMPEPFPFVTKGGVTSRKRVKFVRYLQPELPNAATVAPSAGAKEMTASAPADNGDTAIVDDEKEKVDGKQPGEKEPKTDDDASTLLTKEKDSAENKQNVDEAEKETPTATQGEEGKKEDASKLVAADHEKEEKKEDATAQKKNSEEEEGAEPEAAPVDLESQYEGNWRIFSAINDGVDVGVERARI